MAKYITYNKSKKIRLSKNFTLDEFLYSEVALRKGINNRMPTTYLKRIQDLVTYVLQPLRDKFGRIKISSGYRNVELCIAVGSSKTSNHARGLAADIKFKRKSVKFTDVLKFIETNLEFKELIAEYFPYGWIHVAYDQYNNKRTVKLKDSTNNYTRTTVKSIVKKYKKVV